MRPSILEISVGLTSSSSRLNYRLAKASSDLRTVETTFVRGYLYERVGITKLRL